GLLAETVLPVGAAQLAAEGGRARVLPHDRVVHGLARGAVPQDRGLPLVGDAERAQLVGPQTGLRERPGHHHLHLGPDLGGVVLHPARPGEDLAVFALVDGDDRAVLVEDDATTGGGALIDRGDERVRHGVPFVDTFGTFGELLVRKTARAEGCSFGGLFVRRAVLRIRRPR